MVQCVKHGRNASASKKQTQEGNMIAPKPKQHQFSGEMRIRINKMMYRKITKEEVMELVQQAMEGESVEGIKIEKFEVRDEDKTESAETGEYGFASAFMSNAKRTKEQSKKSHMQKGKK